MPVFNFIMIILQTVVEFLISFLFFLTVFILVAIFWVVMEGCGVLGSGLYFLYPGRSELSPNKKLHILCKVHN
jgi:hypothetical protein